MDEVWLVIVGVGAMFSAVASDIFANRCKASPWRPWNVWFSLPIVCIVRVSVVFIIFVMSISFSVGIVQYLG